MQTAFLTSSERRDIGRVESVIEDVAGKSARVCQRITDATGDVEAVASRATTALGDDGVEEGAVRCCRPEAKADRPQSRLLCCPQA